MCFFAGLMVGLVLFVVAVPIFIFVLDRMITTEIGRIVLR
jgi:hypothetical protein